MSQFKEPIRAEPTPAEAARLAAGYDLKRAAKKLKCQPRTVRTVELKGGGSDLYCLRAARLFRCDASLFFHPPKYLQQLSQTANEHIKAGLLERL